MRGLLLAAALVLVAGCTLAPDVDAPPIADAPVPADGAALGCRTRVEQAASLPVPPGATSAQICEAGFFRWQPPQQVLTEDVEALLEVLAAPGRVDDPVRYCTMIGGTGFDLRLAYPDGTVLSVPGDTGGCGELEVGGERYEGAQAVLDAFLDGIRAQRAGAEPSYEPVRLACGSSAGGPRLALIREPRRIVRAISCWRENADELGPFRRSRVSVAQLRLLLTDLDRRSVRQRSFTQPACRSSDVYYWQDIVGQTDWGDLVRIGGVCREFRVDDDTFWTPGERAQRVLDRLRERAGG